MKDEGRNRSRCAPAANRQSLAAYRPESEPEPPGPNHWPHAASRPEQNRNINLRRTQTNTDEEGMKTEG